MPTKTESGTSRVKVAPGSKAHFGLLEAEEGRALLSDRGRKVIDPLKRRVVRIFYQTIDVLKGRY